MNQFWPESFEEARRYQEERRHAIRIQGKPKAVRYVAGVDLSSLRGCPKAWAAVVVLRTKTFKIVETVTAEKEMTFPYVPGYLSFREGPVIWEAISRVKTSVDLWFFDGHGYAHPRRFGLASHMGLLLGQSAIGVAKKPYIGQHVPLGMKAGNREKIEDAGEVIGYALRSRDRVSPVYVSPGHLISAPAAVDWAFRMTGKLRIPEPTRQAHMAVNRFRREQTAF
jgi:deoxyribonuclease V